MIAPVAVLVALAILLAGVVRSALRNANPEARIPEGAWSAARDNETSQIGRMLMSVTKPVSNIVEINPQTNVYRNLHVKLAAAGGGLYGGSVEIFLSVQVGAILLATTGLALIPLTGLSGLPLIAALLGCLVIAVYPYNQVHDAGKKRLAQIRDELPEFAELLLMPVSSGYGILPALSFTAQRMPGLVSSEVRTMLSLLSSRSASEAVVFESTGARMGDPAAVTFFNTLYQSYTDGTGVTEALRAQAEQLRHQEHQRKRAMLKQLPNKMVFIIALHLLPFIFVVTVLPTLFAMGSMS